MNNLNKQTIKTTLQWLIESGADEFLSDTPFKEPASKNTDPINQALCDYII